jgi:hypothetical protein
MSCSVVATYYSSEPSTSLSSPLQLVVTVTHWERPFAPFLAHLPVGLDGPTPDASGHRFPNGLNKDGPNRLLKQHLGGLWLIMVEFMH